MCVENPRTGPCFSEMIDMSGHMPSLLEKLMFPIYLLRNPINVC